jgi:hypothetical protein
LQHSVPKGHGLFQEYKCNTLHKGDTEDNNNNNNNNNNNLLYHVEMGIKILEQKSLKCEDAL